MLNNIYTYYGQWLPSLSRHDAAAEGGVQEGDVVIYRLLQPQQNRGWGVGTSTMESHGHFYET
jgi:hypothetical protein